MTNQIGNNQNEILKIKKLEEENKILKEENIKLKNELNNKNKLKIELNKIINENKKLKNDLLKANKLLNNIGNNNEIKDLKYQLVIKDNEIKDLKYQLILKDNKIKDLKIKSQNKNQNNKQILNMDEIMIVYFQSLDQEINHVGIKCLPNDTFAEVEEKLYKKFENFRNTNNTPICNGRTILRFKKLSENNINDGDVVQLIKME